MPAKKKVVKKSPKKKEDEVEETEEIDGSEDVGLGNESEESDDEDLDAETEEEFDEENEESEETEDETPAVKLLTCPKCHAKYSEDHMENKEAIVHGIKDAEGEMKIDYFCPPCALSWLERSSAKLA